MHMQHAQATCTSACTSAVVVQVVLTLTLALALTPTLTPSLALTLTLSRAYRMNRMTLRRPSAPRPPLADVTG